MMKLITLIALTVSLSACSHFRGHCGCGHKEGEQCEMHKSCDKTEKCEKCEHDKSEQCPMHPETKK